MRFRTHLLISSLAGAALYPRAPGRATLLALGGVLLDIDHYVLYALRSGDWSPLGALSYNRRRNRLLRPGDTRPRYGSLRSVFHLPRLTLPILWLLSQRWPALRPFALGMALHLLLDAPLTLRFDGRVWRRARSRCERCGVGGLALGIHHVRPVERGGARWALANRALWCHECAREMHKRGA